MTGSKKSENGKPEVAHVEGNRKWSPAGPLHASEYRPGRLMNENGVREEDRRERYFAASVDLISKEQLDWFRLRLWRDVMDC